MAHLKNTQLLLSIVALLMLLLAWAETARLQWAMFLFTLTVAAGWAFTFPVIKNRFDDLFANKVLWVVPAIASLWLAITFWLSEQSYAALSLTLLLTWVTGLLLFTRLDLEKTAASSALPTLSLVMLFLLQPVEQLGLSSPILFAFSVY